MKRHRLIQFALVGAGAAALGGLMLSLSGITIRRAPAAEPPPLAAPALPVSLRATTPLSLATDRAGNPQSLRTALRFEGTFPALLELNLAAPPTGTPPDIALSGTARLADTFTMQTWYGGTARLRRATDGFRFEATLFGAGDLTGTSLSLEAPVSLSGVRATLGDLVGTAHGTPPDAAPASPFEEALPWFVSRAAGMAAFALLSLGLIAGLAITTRAPPSGTPRFGVFELHQALTIAAFVFVALHVGVLLVDRFVGFSPVQILVPLASDYEPEWVAVGIVAMYLLAAVVASFFVRRWLGYRLWRLLHYATYLIYAGALVHGLMIGTDARLPAVQIAMLTSALAIGALTAWRLALRVPRRPPRGRTAASVVATGPHRLGGESPRAR